MAGTTLSENSNVKIGFVVITLGAVAGFVVGAVWWAATLQTKVDSLLTMTAANAVVHQSMQEDVNKLRERVIILEQRIKP